MATSCVSHLPVNLDSRRQTRLHKDYFAPIGHWIKSPWQSPALAAVPLYQQGSKARSIRQVADRRGNARHHYCKRNSDASGGINP